MSKCYQLNCRDVALYYMIHEVAWQLTTGESTHDWGSDLPPHTAVDITHTAVLSHAYLSVSCGRLALLLNLEERVWLPTTDQRHLPPLQPVRHCCHQMRRRRTLFIFQSPVTLCHVCSWSYIGLGRGQKIRISVSAENDVLGLTLIIIKMHC